MSVAWLTPMALWGLVLVAVPVAIHLLVRQQSRRVDYPSLRFLRQSQLAAFRRRHIQDALLLACRAAIVAAAVLALAGPVLQTTLRSAAYNARTARAVILEAGIAAPPPEAVGDAFVSRTFTRQRVGDAIADATRWLEGQPRASREVVLVGALRQGSLTPGDLRAVPAAAGIRFVAVAGTVAGRDLQMPVLRSHSAGLVIEQRQVRLEDDSTQVTAGPATPAASDLVRVVAAAPDQPMADAALRAALAAGLQWRDATQRVLLVWDGADEAMVQRVLAGATLVRMARPAPLSAAASAVVNAIEGVTAAPVKLLEPVRISDEQLRAWSRPPGGVPAETRPADEGDRRWLWAVALALLALEHWLRRTTTSAVAAEPAEEARVA